MRSLTILACATLVAGSSAFGEPATQPFGAPPANAAHLTPTTQPVPAESATILILPFADVLGAPAPWRSRELQQDVAISLRQTSIARIDAPPSALPARDARSASEAGRNAGADVVVFGQYWFDGPQAKVAGQAIDVKSGQSLGSVFADSPQTNLFPMEDAITSQLVRDLPPAWLTVAPVPAHPGVAGAGSNQPPPNLKPPAYYSYTFPDYGADSGDYFDDGYYPYYGYAAPYYYGPDFWFFGGDSFHHHFHHHGGEGEHDHDWHGSSHSFGGHPGGSGSHASGGGSHGGGGGGGHR